MTPTCKKTPDPTERERLAKFIGGFLVRHLGAYVIVTGTDEKLADALLAAGYMHRDDAREEAAKIADAHRDRWSNANGFEGMASGAHVIADALRQKAPTDERPYTDAEIAAEEPSND